MTKRYVVYTDTSKTAASLEARLGLYGVAITDERFAGGASDLGVLDATPAILATIAYASPLKLTVFVPPARVAYRLNGVRQAAYRSNSGLFDLVADTLIPIPAGLRVQGVGYQSVFKVADGYSAGGDYRVIGPSSQDSSNVEISGIRIDGNALNNLVIDSAANVRRAYMINLLTGDNVSIHDNWFENCPGRNVVNLGNNTAGAYDFTDSRIERNRFKDVGGAIVGNENQSDHSSIYFQCDRGLVADNFFKNTVQPNQFGAPAQHTVNAIEVHGKNTIVRHNEVRNFTHGGVLPAQVHDSINNEWFGNKFYGITQNVLNLSTAAGYYLRRLVIRDNVVEIDNSVFAGGAGIFQNPSAVGTNTAIEDIVIEDNIIYATVNASQAITWHGIQLCAVESGSIKRNRFRYIQGDAINLEANAVNLLSIRNVDVDDNTTTDCGIHVAATRPWAIFISNAAVDAREIANVRVRRNRILRTYQATVFTCRGMRVSGVAAGAGGNVSDVMCEANYFDGIQRSQRFESVNTTNFHNVGYVPQAIPHARATDPTEGFWHSTPLIEYVVNNDPVSAGFFGKIASTPGSAVGGVWAVATNYAIGQWIRTSTNKVLKCIASGVSDAAVEPAPATLGQLVADGTAQWLYVDTAIAIFKTFGVIS